MKTDICTSIEQSRKLMKLGVDPSTADMYWACRYDRIRNKSIEWPVVRRRLPDGDYLPLLSQDIPCWSLPALLKIMPDTIRVREEYYTFSLVKSVIEYIGHDGNALYSAGGESFVDAAVKMLELISGEQSRYYVGVDIGEGKDWSPESIESENK